MRSVMNSKPLDNFPVIRSSSVEEVRQAFASVYARPTLFPTHGVENFSARMNMCELRDVALGYNTFGAAVELDFPATDFLCQLLPICGGGEITVGRTSIELTPDAGAVISSGTPHKRSISPDYEHLTIRLDAQALVRKLAALTGASISEPLRINPQQTLTHPAAKMLQHYVPLLAATLSSTTSPFPDWWMTQVEQLVMTLFLCGHRHNYSHLLEQEVPEAAPSQVRQAEEYIAANTQRAITLEELAAVSGVSAFSLFGAFRRYRGYSPLEFAKRLRSRSGGRH
jgi:hypothetical protein